MLAQPTKSYWNFTSAIGHEEAFLESNLSCQRSAGIVLTALHSLGDDQLLPLKQTCNQLFPLGEV